MARSFQRYITRLSLLLCFPVFTFGQAVEEEAPAYTGVVRFYVRGSANFRDLVIFENPTSPLKINLYNGRASRDYPVEGGLDYGIFRQIGVRDGVPQYQAAARVTLDPELSETMILLLPNPAFGTGGEELEFLAFAVDDSPAVKPMDHVVFWNLTGATLDGVVGTEPVTVRDGLSSAISVKEYFGEKSSLVGLTVRYEGKDHIVLESRIRFYPDRHMTIVLLPPKDPGSLSIEAFRIMKTDRSPPEE
jgi:hypothetical protein